MNGSSFSKEEAEEWLSKFSRIFDLYQCSKVDDPKNYFNFEELIPWSAANFAEIEKTLTRLDVKSWEKLRAKTLSFITADHSLRRYQQVFNHLNEARGYVFLADQGYTQIEFIVPEQNKKGALQSPDLFATKTDSTAILEVKTVNESDENLNPNASWRNEAVTVRQNLSPEFKGKLNSTIEQARGQLNSYPHSSDRKIVFLIVRFDHGQKTAWHLYSELKEFITAKTKEGVEVYYEPQL
jgi:hypothetical protein